MFFKFKRSKTRQTIGSTRPRCAELVPSTRETALRDLYERIAHGHALAEAEEQAQRKWRGR